MAGKRGRPPGQRTKRRGRPLTEEERAQKMRNLLKGGDNEAVKAAREKKRAEAEAESESVRTQLQTCDIVTFAGKFLKLSLDGYPFLELLLRCSQGLPLPEGTLKTYVEVKSAGFAVKEVEMTWPEYFEMLSCGPAPRVYKPGKRPSVIGARVGRRGGKSTALSVISLWTGVQKRWREYVRPSEIIKIPIIATSQDQAEEIITQRCHELLMDAKLDWLIGPLDPALHQGQVTNDTIPLITGTEIAAFPCNSKKVRGPASPLVALDEYAHFAIEGRKKDEDIREAATGSQGQFPGCQEYMISTPLTEEGDFYRTEMLAREGEPTILFFHAPSWTAAPILYRNNPEYYQNKFRFNPDKFHIEYRAEYGTSQSPAFQEVDIDAAMVLSGEMPFNPSCRYGAGIDQSGLSGNDRFSAVICGYDPARDKCFEAARRNWATKDLDLIMSELRQMLQTYRVYEVATDRYAANYVANALSKEGITGVPAGDTTDLCVAFRELMIGRKMELPYDKSVKLGLQQTSMVLTDKARKPVVWHPRGKSGHGDEVDARFRAAHQAMTRTWARHRLSSNEEREAEQRRNRQAEYDPLAIPAG